MSRIVVVTTFLMACTGAWANPPPLHAVDRYCAVYQIDGVTKGELKTCQKDFGNKRFELWNTTTGFGPFKQKDERHVIFIQKHIFTKNKGQALKTTNPAYEQIAARMQSADPETLQKTFMEAMQYQPTGELKRVGNVDCEVSQSPGLGTVCLTPEGVLAEQSALGQTQRLIKLTLGDAGDATLYDPEAWGLPITDGPDVGRMLEGLQGLQQPNSN